MAQTTVNRKGQRANVDAGVCSSGSSRDKKGYKKFY